MPPPRAQAGRGWYAGSYRTRLSAPEAGQTSTEFSYPLPITTHHRPPGREGAPIPRKVQQFRRLQAELESGSENHLPLPERNVLSLGPAAQPFMERRIGETTGL